MVKAEPLSYVGKLTDYGTGSQGVVIPKYIKQALNLKKGDLLQITVKVISNG